MTFLPLRELGRGSGYGFTSSKPIFGEVPIENATALIEEATNQKE